MKPSYYFKFLHKFLTHKYYVFKYGLRLKVPIWQLITHDMSKLSWTELNGYVKFIFIDKDRDKFMLTWNHHLKHNKHHPEYWIIPNKKDSHKIEVLDMPEKYVREMIADWHGAGMAYVGHDDVSEWFIANQKRFNFSKNTTEILKRVLIEDDLENLSKLL